MRHRFWQKWSLKLSRGRKLVKSISVRRLVNIKCISCRVCVCVFVCLLLHLIHIINTYVNVVYIMYIYKFIYMCVYSERERARERRLVKQMLSRIQVFTTNLYYSSLLLVFTTREKARQADAEQDTSPQHTYTYFQPLLPVQPPSSVYASKCALGHYHYHSRLPYV